MDFEAGVSVNPVDGINAPRRRAAAHVAASGLALIESAVPRQEADVVRDMTPLTLFTNQNALAATPGNYPHYLATSANWSSIRNGVLLNYPAALKSILDQYIAEGYHLLLPQAGQLRQEGYSIYVGGTGNATRTVKLVESPSTSSAELLRSAFFAYKPDGTGSIGGAAFLMYDPRRGRVLKGGVGVSLIDHVNRVLKKPEPPKAADKDAVFAAVDVNQNNGRFTYTPSADLTDGFGDFPHSLSLQRQYRMNDLADYGFGVGWRHNWHHQVTLSNDGHAAFGQLGAQGAASALVAIQAVADILGTDPSPARILAAAHVQDWLADQTINNVAVVSNGLDADASYLRQNDGSFMPAKFDGSRLVQQGEPIDSIINRRIYHQVGFTLTGRDGDVRTYTFLDAYSPNLYEAVYVAPLARKSLHLSRWTMADGIRLSLAYQQNSLTDTFYLYSVENSLGRKIVNSLFDPGDRGDRPMCSGPYSLVTYSEPRDGEVRYKNSAQQEVRFTKTAAVKFSLAPGTEPDMARCDANGEIATRLSTFPSSLTAAFDLSNGKWSYGNGTIPDLYGSLTSQGTLSGLARIYKPSMPGTPAIQVTFGNDANVRTITDATGQAYQYFSSPFRGASENPLAERSVSIFDRDGQTIRTIDPLGRVVRNDYDPEGRLVRTTSPDLDAVEYTYDVRSNRLTERKKAKPGTGLADIVTTTEYFEGPSIASCANLKTCNKPRYAWDGRSNRTDYDWDGATGQLKSVTSPPDAAGVRPQVSYGYTSFAGADGASFSLPTSKVERIDGATSTTTSFSYDSANKYVPKETVVDAGGLSLRTCAHFDATGNITSVTDPRAGGCQ